MELSVELHQDCVVLMVLSFRKWVCFFRQDIDPSSQAAIPVYKQACYDIYAYAPELREAVTAAVVCIDDVERNTLEWDWRIGPDFIEPVLARYSTVPMSSSSLLTVLYNFDLRRQDPLCVALEINALRAIKPVVSNREYEEIREAVAALRKEQ